MDTLTEQSFAILREDGRASFSDIARQLGTNRSNIAKRLNPLLQSGAIRIVAAVHPRLLGLHVMAHLTIRAEGNVQRLADQICGLISPVFVSEITGPSQLIAELHAATMSELHEEIGSVRAMPGVRDVQILIYEKVLKSFFLGEEPQLSDLGIDAIDLTLMELLQTDGRLGYAELAEEVGLSISGCRTRINRLTDDRAMRIGLLRQRADLIDQLVFGFGFGTSDSQDQLVALIKSQPGLEFIARTVGRFDFVSTIAFSSLLSFNVFVAAVRNLGEVRVVETWLHAEIRKERYQESLHRISGESLPLPLNVAL